MDEAVGDRRGGGGERSKVGDPLGEGDQASARCVSDVQFNKIQRLIEKGIDEGAELVTGGPGRPEGLSRGFYVQPDRVRATSRTT